MHPPIRTAADRRRSPDDAGFTLIGLMVTMGIMAVVMSIATAGILQMFTSANKDDSMSIVQDQLHIAFIRLDRDIRYASGITAPERLDNANWYVEYAITNTGVTHCTQLRLVGSTGLLQSRTRRDAEPSGWSTLASYVTTPHAFARIPAASDGAPYQQLSVSLTVEAGAGRTLSRRQSEFTFTALNTSVATSSDDVCSGMARA